MAKSVKRGKHPIESVEMPQMPFDDALRKILSAPPQPMPKRKKSKRALSKRAR